jgi:rhamnogalacturonyl hydrolase YesR
LRAHGIAKREWFVASIVGQRKFYLKLRVQAMFAFAIARGVNRGWIEAIYAPVAQAMARGREVTEDGQIAGVCRGTSVGYNMVYYANRPQLLHAYHGYAR